MGENMIRKLALLLLILALPASAQDKRYKNPFKSKKYWIETAITVGFAILDAESTVRLNKVCSTCTESNRAVFNSRPSRGELYAKGGAIIASERLLIAALWPHPKTHKWAQVLSTSSATGHAIYHSLAARHNFSLADKCQKDLACMANPRKMLQ